MAALDKAVIFILKQKGIDLYFKSRRFIKFHKIKYPALAGQDTKMEGFMKKFLSAFLLMIIL